MPSLQSVKLQTIKQVEQFVEKLMALKIVESNAQHITTSSVNLSKHLFVATNGNTYLKEDIDLLSEHEAQLNGDVKFLTKTGEIKTLIDLKKEIDDQIKVQDYIHNKPLAEALTKININKKRLLSLPLMFSKPIHPFVITSPVITLAENTYEEYNIHKWLERQEKNHRPLVHPNTIDGVYQPLSKSEIIPNKALENLMQVSLLQGQERKIEYQHSVSNMNEDDPRKQLLEAEIKKLDQVNIAYQDSLIAKKIHFENIIQPKQREIKEIFSKNPSWESKNSRELDTIIENNKRRIPKLEKFIQNSERTLNVAVLTVLLAMCIGGLVIGGLVFFAIPAAIGIYSIMYIGKLVINKIIEQCERTIDDATKVRDFINDETVKVASLNIKEIDAQIEKLKSSHTSSSSMTKVLNTNTVSKNFKTQNKSASYQNENVQANPKNDDPTEPLLHKERKEKPGFFKRLFGKKTANTLSTVRDEENQLLDSEKRETPSFFSRIFRKKASNVQMISEQKSNSGESSQLLSETPQLSEGRLQALSSQNVPNSHIKLSRGVGEVLVSSTSSLPSVPQESPETKQLGTLLPQASINKSIDVPQGALQAFSIFPEVPTHPPNAQQDNSSEKQADRQNRRPCE